LPLPSWTGYRPLISRIFFVGMLFAGANSGFLDAGLGQERLWLLPRAAKLGTWDV